MTVPPINLSLKDWIELSEEINSFNEDYSKYRTGVFLWINEKYPNFVQFLNVISKGKLSSTFHVLNGMESAVKDYFGYIDQVKNSSLNLYNNEITESKNLVFDKTIRPINILKQKNAVLNFLLNNLSDNISSYINLFKKLIEKYTPEIQNGVKSSLEKIRPQFTDRMELVLKFFKGEITQEQFDSTIQEYNKDLEMIGNENKQKAKVLADRIKEETKESKSEAYQFLDEAKKITVLLKEAYTQDPTKLIYEYLSLTKDIDSFNIKFTKFLNRLFHILSFNNRNYKIYYKIGKFHRQERIELKKYLSLELKKLYPNIANFLLRPFNYNKFRRIEAHEIPDKIKLSNDKKIAYIPKTGTSPEIQMDIEEISCMLNTYCFFIDAIGI